jgi:hypothetical protein
MTVLSDARIENHRFITSYLAELSESDKRKFPEGEFHIDSKHSFYVKNNIVFNETIIHTNLTEHAISEKFGGILLLFGWSNSNIVKDEHPTFNLFIELSEGLTHTAKSKIQVIDSLLWMHRHNYVHLDLYNNNIFRLGEDAVIGDFDRSAHSADITIKFQDLSHFYAWLPKPKIGLFKHLLITIPNGGKQIQYIKCEDKLMGVLETNIQSQLRLKERYKNPEMQLEVDKNIAMYREHLDDCNRILESPVLTRKIYKEFKNAMIDISLLESMPINKSTRKTKSKPKKVNTRRNTI